MDPIGWFYNFGFEHYGLFMIISFVCFYLTFYVIGHEAWDWALAAGAVILSGILATGWPAFFSFWILAAIAVGPGRFIFRWLEEQADKYIIRTDNKNTKRKVNA